MAVTISPGWGNMSWAQDPREEAGLFGSNKFQARTRRFREETPTEVATTKSPVDYDASGAVNSFADLADTAYAPDYASPAYDRAKDALYSGVKDVGIKSLTNAGTYSLASTLANSFSPSTALGVALNPSNLASAAPALAGNVLSSAMGLQPNNLTTGVRAVGSALSFVNPAIGMLSGVLAPQIAESVGKVFGVRTDEKMKQAMEDATGKNYFGAASLTSDLNSHARMTPNIPDTFTNVDGYRQTMDLSTDEARANAIGSAAALSRYGVDARQDAYSKNFSDYGKFDTVNDALSQAALGQMQASLVGSPVEQAYSYVSPFEDLSAINNYYSLANPAEAATGWNGNTHSINNPGRFNAAALGAGIDVGSMSPAARLSNVRTFNQLGFTTSDDLGKALREMQQNNFMSTLASSTGARGLGGGNFSGGSRTGTITGSSPGTAAIGRINDALGDNAAPGGDPDSGSKGGGYGGEHGGNGLGGEGEGGSPAGGI